MSLLALFLGRHLDRDNALTLRGFDCTVYYRALPYASQ